MTFDTVIMVDWSGGNDRGPSPKADAIWTCLARPDTTEGPVYHRNRQVAEVWLTETLSAERAAGHRVLAGFDLCFAYPTGFASALTGTADPFAVWNWFADRVEDGPKGNNRFDLAGRINGTLPGIGPFWGNGLGRDIPDLPRKGNDRTYCGLPEKRRADAAAKGAFSPWQLAGAGAVGGQAIMAFPTLARFRRQFGDCLCVWPFQPATAQITLAETYFSMTPKALSYAARTGGIKDAHQVALYAQIFANLSPMQLTLLFDVPPSEEGWVLGLGHEAMLEEVASEFA